MSEALKIMTISLVDGKKFKASAVYDGERLVIVDVRPITGIFSSWKGPLIDEIKKRTADGYAVIVEEVGDSISQYGTQYLLDEIDDLEGKTRMQMLLDGYFEMEGIGALVISKDCAKFALKIGSEGGWIEKKNDEKGRPYYSIDWKRLTGAHRAILLCVVVAMHEPISERYLHAMWGRPDDDPAENPVYRWQSMIDARDLERGKELDRIREGRG